MSKTLRKFRESFNDLRAWDVLQDRWKRVRGFMIRILPWPLSSEPRTIAAERSYGVRSSDPTIVRRRLHTIPTRAHATPAATMVLGRVVENEDARLILTFLDEREIGVTKKIARRFRHR